MSAKQTYDFDKIIDRHGTSCAKWDHVADAFGEKGLLPMFVADMDFRSPPAVIDALVKRAEHGFFGYSVAGDDYYEAVTGWFERRHGWEIPRKWFSWVPQVVNSLGVSIQAYTAPGDGVIVQTPCYDEFAAKTIKSGRHVMENALIQEPDGTYSIDFDDFEKQAGNPRTRLFLLCNPHNPTGRSWTRDELERMAEICLRHSIIIVSDEIHGDMVFKKGDHINMATVSADVAQQCVTSTAISKTFNCPSLLMCDVIIPNPELKSRFDAIAIDCYNFIAPPCFGIEAVKAAYNHGDDWLDQVLAYIKGNHEYASNFLKENAPALKMPVPEATYFGWMDCRALGVTHSALEDFFVDKLKLGVYDGYIFGENGAGFLRFNIGTQRSRVEDAMQRIAKAARLRLVTHGSSAGPCSGH